MHLELVPVPEVEASSLTQHLADYVVRKLSFYSNNLHFYNYESFGYLHIIQITQYCH
jgi:hypothetical protein